MIPKMIFDYKGNEGMIGFLLAKYGNEFLKNIPKKEYELMRQLLMELFKNGFQSILYS